MKATLHTAALASAALLSACFVNTQRLVAPMPADLAPLPPGSADQHPRGPEEVIVLRHADPVQLRPAGAPFGHPLPFYRKQTRAHAGAWVFSGPGGRVEILWPSGGSALLHGKTTVVVGSPSRGEPAFLLKELERLTLNFGEEGGARLMDGALLEAIGGPFVVERLSPALMRIRNRSKVIGTLSYRAAQIVLDPGSVVDVPILSIGAAPIPVDPDLRALRSGGFEVSVRGDVDVEETAWGVRFTGRGEHEIQGLGLRIQLGEGEGAILSGLDGVGRVPPVAPAPTDEPEDAAGPAGVAEPEVVDPAEVAEAPEVSGEEAQPATPAEPEEPEEAEEAEEADGPEDAEDAEATEDPEPDSSTGDPETR